MVRYLNLHNDTVTARIAVLSKDTYTHFLTIISDITLKICYIVRCSYVSGVYVYTLSSEHPLGVNFIYLYQRLVAVLLPL